MRHLWDQDAWADDVWRQTQDRRIATRINVLVRDIARATAAGSPHEGIGKPEALKHGLHGYWSRRITDEHLLVYQVVDDEIRIAACRYHYEA
jgi:toxin YoeB